MFCWTVCAGEKEPPKVVSISMELTSNSKYTLTNNTITIVYGEKVVISDVEFVVTATMGDGETKTITIKSDSNIDGFTFSSDIPSDV